MTVEGQQALCRTCGLLIRFQEDGWFHVPGDWDDFDGFIDAEDEHWANRHIGEPDDGFVRDDVAERAIYFAMCVRNALEGVLHGDGGPLADEHMAVLNPLVRNAIATAIYAEEHARVSDAAAAYVAFQKALVPEYWERPELAHVGVEGMLGQ